MSYHTCTSGSFGSRSCSSSWRRRADASKARWKWRFPTRGEPKVISVKRMRNDEASSLKASSVAAAAPNGGVVKYEVQYREATAPVWRGGAVYEWLPLIGRDELRDEMERAHHAMRDAQRAAAGVESRLKVESIDVEGGTMACKVANAGKLGGKLGWFPSSYCRVESAPAPAQSEPSLLGDEITTPAAGPKGAIGLLDDLDPLSARAQLVGSLKVPLLPHRVHTAQDSQESCALGYLGKSLGLAARPAPDARACDGRRAHVELNQYLTHIHI